MGCVHQKRGGRGRDRGTEREESMAHLCLGADSVPCAGGLAGVDDNRHDNHLNWRNFRGKDGAPVVSVNRDDAAQDPLRHGEGGLVHVSPAALLGLEADAEGLGPVVKVVVAGGSCAGRQQAQRERERGGRGGVRALGKNGGRGWDPWGSPWLTLVRSSARHDDIDRHSVPRSRGGVPARSLHLQVGQREVGEDAARERQGFLDLGRGGLLGALAGVALVERELPRPEKRVPGLPVVARERDERGDEGGEEVR